MKKTLLLIDDDEEYKEAFLIEAQTRSFQLIYEKSFEGLQTQMPKYYHIITAVVLDIKCLMTEDEEIEKVEFIGAAFKYLDTNFPGFPRIVMTGDDEAFEQWQKYTSNEFVYQKTEEGIKQAFKKLEFIAENPPMNLIQNIINNGENKTTEFKSSLQYCLRTKKKENYIEHSAFKTIAAFLNSEGGSLLIGVHDDGNIIGLEETDFLLMKGDGKKDSFLKTFDNLMEKYLSNNLSSEINNSFCTINGKTILKVEVKRKKDGPVFLKNKLNNNEEFFIRRNVSTVPLVMSDAHNYIKNKWK